MLPLAIPVLFLQSATLSEITVREDHKGYLETGLEDFIQVFRAERVEDLPGHIHKFGLRNA